MTELATQELARARAARIRAGIQTYLHTLADVSAAYAQRDWTALGYADWQAYVDGEFSEAKLRLSPEHRQKAVAELRLAGMSQRAIGTALGVGQSTVRDDLAQLSGSTQLPERVASLDGRERPATRPQTPAPFPGPETEAAGTSTPAASVHSIPAPEYAADDARRDAELAAELANTATRFRANFSTTVARADDLWQFDVNRIVEVYAVDYDRAVRPFLEEMTRWIERVEQARRQQTSGLRLVNGGTR